MRGFALFIVFVSFVGVIACAAEEDAPAVATATKPGQLPANRRDPEDRKGAENGASAGSSAARPAAPAPKDTTPARGTDLGKEADKEDEAFRKRRSEKP